MAGGETLGPTGFSTTTNLNKIFCYFRDATTSPGLGWPSPTSSKLLVRHHKPWTLHSELRNSDEEQLLGLLGPRPPCSRHRWIILGNALQHKTHPSRPTDHTLSNKKTHFPRTPSEQECNNKCYGCMSNSNIELSDEHRISTAGSLEEAQHISDVCTLRQMRLPMQRPICSPHTCPSTGFGKYNPLFRHNWNS